MTTAGIGEAYAIKKDTLQTEISERRDFVE